MKPMFCKIYLILFSFVFLSVDYYASAQSGAKDWSQLPIKPTRRITITTDQGSFMDVDISPDGNKILFTLLGELFVVSSNGGEALQLTKGMAINAYPVWSPDGKYIAYISDASGEKHMHIRDLAGKYHKVLGRNESGLWFDWFPPSERKIEPIWLPGGESIILGLHVYHLSGFKSKLMRAFIKENNRYLSPGTNYNQIVGLTADGRYVFFYDNEMKRYDTQTGSLITVSKNDQIASQNNISLENNARLSPNGDYITYIKKSKNSCISDSLMVFTLKDSSRRSVVSLQTKNSGRICERHYAFSANSKFIYIGFGGKIHRITVQNGKDEIINFKANVQVHLGPLVKHNFRISFDSLEVKYTRSANCNPSNSKLVFSALGSIYIQDLQGGKPSKLVEQSAKQYYPVFSPDGESIAYVTVEDSEGNGNVWRVSARGGIPHKVSSSVGQYANPAWSPDGKSFVVIKNNVASNISGRTGAQIQLYNLHSGVIEVLADEVPFHNRASFSADGTKVYFVPKQGGIGVRIKADPKFAYVNLDDTAHKQNIVAVGGTLSGTGVDTYSEQMIISPDGRYLIYTDEDDLCLAPLANLGQPTLIHDTVYGSESVKLPIIRLVKGAYDPHWENGGSILSWSFGNIYYRVNVSKILDACLQANIEGAAKDSRLAFIPANVIDVPLIADQKVQIHLKVPKYCAQGVIALKNARILTMRATDVIENGTVLIKNGRVIAVGDSKHVTAPAGAQMFDFTGKTIIPGLIDIHVHAGPKSDMLPLLHDNWLASFAYGVTTIRDPAGSINELGFAELTETGKTTGPRVFSVGHAVVGAWSQRDVTCLNDARILISNLASLGVIGVKQYTLPSRLQKQWLLIASQKAGVNMTNEGGRLPLEYLGMIKDGSPGVEHIPIFGDIYNDVIKFLAASGTYITPTLQVAWGKNEQQSYEYFRSKSSLPTNKLKNIMSEVNYKLLERTYKDYFKNMDSIGMLECSGELENFQLVAAVRKAGGKISFGSHTEDLGIGAHFELWALQMGGLSNYEVLQVATIESARALGLQKDLGSIEVGKIADLVILDKNPLIDIHNSTSIRYVMKDGVLYDGDTLDTIWPVKRKLREGEVK